MEQIKEFRLIFPDGKTVYTAGDQIKGALYVNFKEPFEMINMALRFCGEADCIWRDEDKKRPGKREKTEKIVQLERIIFGSEKNARMMEIPVHPPGRYKYDFEFLTPKYLPSSFESPEDQDLGFITYTLSAIIHRHWMFDEEVKTKIIINELSKSNSQAAYYRPVSSTESPVGYCNNVCRPAGTISLKGSLDRGYYLQGENILISALASNDSSKIMDSLYAKLIKQTRYRKNNQTKIYTDDIASYFGGVINPYRYVRWNRIPLSIPMTCSSITGSKTIVVEYLVRIGMYATFGSEIHINLPLHIGSAAEELMEKPPVASDLTKIGEKAPPAAIEEGKSEKKESNAALKAAAEKFKNLPMVGKRPAVQFFDAADRKKRREEEKYRKYSEVTVTTIESEYEQFTTDVMRRKNSKSTDNLNQKISDDDKKHSTGSQQDVSSTKDVAQQRRLSQSTRRMSRSVEISSRNARRESESYMPNKPGDTIKNTPFSYLEGRRASVESLKDIEKKDRRESMIEKKKQQAQSKSTGNLDSNLSRSEHPRTTAPQPKSGTKQGKRETSEGPATPAKKAAPLSKGGDPKSDQANGFVPRSSKSSPIDSKWSPKTDVPKGTVQEQKQGKPERKLAITSKEPSPVGTPKEVKKIRPTTAKSSPSPSKSGRTTPTKDIGNNKAKSSSPLKTAASPVLSGKPPTKSPAKPSTTSKANENVSKVSPKKASTKTTKEQPLQLPQPPLQLPKAPAGKLKSGKPLATKDTMSGKQNLKGTATKAASENGLADEHEKQKSASHPDVSKQTDDGKEKSLADQTDIMRDSLENITDMDFERDEELIRKEMEEESQKTLEKEKAGIQSDTAQKSVSEQNADQDHLNAEEEIPEGNLTYRRDSVSKDQKSALSMIEEETEASKRALEDSGQISPLYHTPRGSRNSLLDDDGDAKFENRPRRRSLSSRRSMTEEQADTGVDRYSSLDSLNRGSIDSLERNGSTDSLNLKKTNGKTENTGADDELMTSTSIKDTEDSELIEKEEAGTKYRRTSVRKTSIITHQVKGY